MCSEEESNMKKLNVSPKKTLCANDDSPFMYFGWPSVTRLPDGTLAMVTSGFRLEHVCPFGKGVICYSRDEGRSWTAPAVIIDTPLDDRDSGITPFAGGRRVIFTSFNNTTAFQRRVNAKRHFAQSPLVRAKADLIDAYLNYVDVQGNADKYLGSTYCISEDGGYAFGDVKVAPITSPHGPCELNDGRLMWVGRRFSEDDSFDEGDEPYIQAYMLGDDDKWHYLSSIENIRDEYGILNSCEPHAIQLPNGKIIVHIRVQRGGEHRVFTIYQSESTDGGATFTKPRKLLDDLGGSPAHLMLHSSGKLISVYGYREQPYGIRAMISADGGATWEIDNVITADGQSGDLGYPATVELKDGSLLTLYYENTDGCSRIMQNVWRI
jgi:sialidase-1